MYRPTKTPDKACHPGGPARHAAPVDPVFIAAAEKREPETIVVASVIVTPPVITEEELRAVVGVAGDPPTALLPDSDISLVGGRPVALIDIDVGAAVVAVAAAEL